MNKRTEDRKKKKLEKELQKFVGSLFDWPTIKNVLLMHGTAVSINTGYGVHLLQVHLDGREIIIDHNDGYIYGIYF